MSAAVSLHERLASALDRSGALDAVLRIRRVVEPTTVTIVTFHRVAELDPDEPYDPEVVDATPAQFRRHVETLARYGTPITVTTLLRALDGAPLPRNPVLITFDDGYRSCRDVALPILRELGVPATFFIATAFASEPRLYWWERIAAVVHAARGRTAVLRYPGPIELDTRDPGARRRLDDLVKNTAGLDVERFLRELSGALDVPWGAEREASLAAPLIMTWDDVRALADAGMDIQSHTRTHRVLETLGPDDLRDELVGSRRDLEQQLGRPVTAIAYPVGRRPPPRVQRAVADAGYRLGLTNASGVNPRWPEAMRRSAGERFEVRRLATERAQSDALFLTQIAMPRLAALHLR